MTTRKAFVSLAKTKGQCVAKFYKEGGRSENFSEEFWPEDFAPLESRYVVELEDEVPDWESLIELHQACKNAAEGVIA
jgi:hypothetical protein